MNFQGARSLSAEGTGCCRGKSYGSQTRPDSRRLQGSGPRPGREDRQPVRRHPAGASGEPHFTTLTLD